MKISYMFKMLLQFLYLLRFGFKQQVTWDRNPPWGKSAEYCLLPVTVQLMLPPLLKKSEHTLDIFLGKCPIVISPFTTATAYRSISLALSSMLGHLLQLLSMYTRYPGYSCKAFETPQSNVAYWWYLLSTVLFRKSAIVIVNWQTNYLCRHCVEIHCVEVSCDTCV